MNVWWGKVDQNCFVESGNSSLSRDPLGPKANHSLHVAGSCILQHTETRHKNLKTEAIKALGSRKSKKEEETEDDTTTRELSRTIIDEKNDPAMDEYLLSKSYWCLEVGTELGAFMTVSSNVLSTISYLTDFKCIHIWKTICHISTYMNTIFHICTHMTLAFVICLYIRNKDGGEYNNEQFVEVNDNERIFLCKSNN